MKTQIEPSPENDRIVAQYIAANLKSTLEEKKYHGSLKKVCNDIKITYIGN